MTTAKEEQELNEGDMKTKTKRMAQCMICGIRIGAAKSAFCRVDMQRHGVNIMFNRLKVHRWVWARTVWMNGGVSGGGFEFI